MVAPRRDLLTDRQWGVLRWVADGMPDALMQGHAHKITAVALENRRLMEILRRDGGVVGRACRIRSSRSEGKIRS